MAASEFVVALTGASGSAYGVRLLEILLRAGRTVHLVVSPAAVEVMQRELAITVDLARFDPALLLVHFHTHELHHDGVELLKIAHNWE